ncbi:MAG: DUF4835 family protein [Prevotellaceae bacterium]|nr:DUF4835 family protein [Prevotellaceae bacterium]
MVNGKSIALFLLVLLSAFLAQAQLRSNVTVSAQKIQGTNAELFQQMKTDVTSFLNNRMWTNHQYEPFERIECNFIITLSEQVSDNHFKGTLQVQAQRPVYGASYNSATLNTIDNEFEFTYMPNELMDFSENTHLSNLTSMLAYWAFIVVGTDYDTFSPRGGTEWFRKAERIAQNAQGESMSGWSASSGMERRNRYWLVENILSEKYARERMASYRYHRQGLDVMSEKPNEGRAAVQQALQEMQSLYREKPDSYMFFYNVFFDTKADEIANIFSEAPQEEREAVLKLLLEINNTNEPKYEKLK